MAQFRATIQGQRGGTSRLGSKRSGLNTTTNGWNIGVRASLSHVYRPAGDTEDLLVLFITGESHDGETMAQIELYETDLNDAHRLAAALRRAADAVDPEVSQ